MNVNINLESAMNLADTWASVRTQHPLTEYEMLAYESVCRLIESVSNHVRRQFEKNADGDKPRDSESPSNPIPPNQSP